ncbi:MAG: hypothetical protein N2508_03590 [Anaerolineae bacterium]|nr:hypothetical protein [Anaerolineae bacterium]
MESSRPRLSAVQAANPTAKVMAGAVAAALERGEYQTDAPAGV